MLEVPSSSLHPNNNGVWAHTVLRGEQIDRMGRPAINTVFIPLGSKNALFLGLTVTVSHTLGVLGLGLIVLYASHVISPERLYPWLGFISGAIIIAIGIWLLASRIRRNQEAPHVHGHQSEVTPGTHSHLHIESVASEPRRYRGRVREAAQKVVKKYFQAHHHVHPHQMPHDGDRLRITWKSLTALGIIGGLLPSTSALLILLAAISLGRIGFGLLLIVAFSAGMAAVLAGVGLLLVYAGRLAERFQLKNRVVRTSIRLLPLTTALVVLVSGLVVAMRAAFQTGLL